MVEVGTQVSVKKGRKAGRRGMKGTDMVDNTSVQLELDTGKSRESILEVDVPVLPDGDREKAILDGGVSKVELTATGKEAPGAARSVVEEVEVPDINMFELNEKEVFLSKLVNKYVNMFVKKAEVDTEAMLMLKETMRALAEKVYGIDGEQVRNINRDLEGEEIEDKLNKTLTDEELFDLVDRQWDDRLFRMVNDDLPFSVGHIKFSGHNLIMIHHLNGKRSGFDTS